MPSEHANIQVKLTHIGKKISKKPKVNYDEILHYGEYLPWLIDVSYNVIILIISEATRCGILTQRVRGLVLYFIVFCVFFCILALVSADLKTLSALMYV